MVKVDILDMVDAGIRDSLKKKLMEFSIKGPDPASQHLNGKKTWSKNALNHLK